MKLKTIGFIGLGLIGGSIARRIKQVHPDTVIMAYMRTRSTLEEAKADGISDILIEVNEDDLRIGMVLELKYSKTENALDKECDYALQQIEDKNYDQELREKGYTKILKYGIAFYHKKCRVKTSFAQTS